MPQILGFFAALGDIELRFGKHRVARSREMLAVVWIIQPNNPVAACVTHHNGHPRAQTCRRSYTFVRASAAKILDRARAGSRGRECSRNRVLPDSGGSGSYTPNSPPLMAADAPCAHVAHAGRTQKPSTIARIRPLRVRQWGVTHARTNLSSMVMKFRSTPPSSSTTVGCVLTGRRFHQWSLSFIDPRAGGVKDLERKCVDCGRRQHTQAVPDHETSELPRTLWCLGDWTWQEGELEP
jgi:hypothetical protein